MKLRFIPALLIFLSSYFPLALIFIIKDLDGYTFLPQHLEVAAAVAIVFFGSCVFVVVAAKSIRGGLEVRILKVSNKSGDMFTYTIPYMISFYNFNLGDWKTLLCLLVFMGIMFLLSYKTQNMLVNPVLALAGYGLYDCQFKDGNTEKQGLLISNRILQVDDTCTIERLSHFLYFVTGSHAKEETHGN